MPEWAVHALNAAKAATVNEPEPFTPATVIIAADAAAAAVAELAWQGQSWEPDSLQERQVPSAAAAHAAGCLWPPRRRGPRGGSLRVVQEQEVLQQLEDHLAEQELEHQQALLQQGFADRAAAARRRVERERSGSICSGSVQQPRRADDCNYVPDQSAPAEADTDAEKKKEEEDKLVEWPADFEPRDPTMPHNRLDMQSLREWLHIKRLCSQHVASEVVVQPALIEVHAAAFIQKSTDVRSRCLTQIVVRHMP